ncbi:uncharacterized protein LOC126899159 [Daktulosphaira vitifoliae]|uniref:uncharacterized protein LOC126899159 n=1 Tax=Daktulosphaira vitifoliae TaxID=58002 RepID=UPI0021A9B33E|nr:uncharacterized protein LOC126899159 [Daktulosphaira vitifoliae]
MSNPNSPKTISNQVITRSNSATAAKASKATLSAPTPLSAEEFRLAFAEIQSTQKQCKTLCASLNKMFSELKNSVDLLSSQLAEIRAENTTIKSDITNLQERISALETASKNDSVLPNLLSEISEREKSLFNIVVHGLSESSETSPSSRANDDIKKLNEVIQPLSLSVLSDCKLFRLGRPNNTKPRPLKVIFSSKEQASSFVIDFNTGKRSLGADNNLQNIHVSRDRTLLERQEIRRVYQDLDNRKKQGETNITIRYRNGFPYIVKNNHISDGSSRTYASKN